jgi:hypothetical protein
MAKVADDRLATLSDDKLDALELLAADKSALQAHPLIEALQSECAFLREEAAYWREQTKGIEVHPHPSPAMVRAEAREREQLERHVVYSFLIGLVTGAWIALLVFCWFMR